MNVVFVILCTLKMLVGPEFVKLFSFLEILISYHVAITFLHSTSQEKVLIWRMQTDGSERYKAPLSPLCLLNTRECVN